MLSTNGGALAPISLPRTAVVGMKNKGKQAGPAPCWKLMSRAGRDQHDLVVGHSNVDNEQVHHTDKTPS